MLISIFGETYSSTMRIFKKILLAVLLLLILAVAGGYLYINSIKPQYSGTLELQDLEAEVSAYLDDFGIPHIYAESQEDAYLALGYLHAQDRLWQMELLKRIAPGRLSEILGKELLKTDRFFVSLGIDEASDNAVAVMDKQSEAYKLGMAYINGVNQYINEGATPIEFTLAGVEKEAFQLKDAYNIFGYMAFSFAMAQKTDPMLTAIQEKLGADYLIDLDVIPNANGVIIKNNRPTVDALAQLSTEIAQITEKLPIPAFIGSNSWVVSAKKSGTGAVILANDPHIGYAQPSVWYEAHIVTPNYEMYGYHLAGIPFPILGHNRDYGYGITMFENDDIDFYKETNHPTDPSKYQTAEGYESYTSVSKTIKVKDEDDVVIEVKSTRHGPIMNTVQDEITVEAPIAMSWVYTQHKIELLEAVFNLSHSKSMQDAKAAASMIHAPGLNIMYGDAKGNIAWWAAGKLYKHAPQVNAKFVLDGASAIDNDIEFLDFKDNPMAENPEWEYVYSANNQPDSVAGIMYPGYYLPEDRGRRIVGLLESKNNWDRDSFAKMIVDVTSPVALENIRELTTVLDYNAFTKNQQRAMDILQLWGGQSDFEDIAPTIYQRFIYKYLEDTFKDELGDELFGQLLKTHLIKRSIALQLGNDASIWWDDSSTTTHIETKKEILNRAFVAAITALEAQLGDNIIHWQWSKVHTLEHNHALGAVETLRPYFNVGPFEVGGTEEVIDNKAFHFNDEGLYKVNSGPSTRRIIDFSDIENSISILPTGQSGNPFSEHYDDQAEMYNNGEFRKMKINKAEIEKTSRLLSIVPKD